ncbi:MAG TPA: hypothetical protein ENI58_10180 [Nitrospirae bacterium]|nr:hypothetical protein [Nitrospirota bacterium]
MAMRSPMYKNNKRKKELSRQKKQEEKRLRRQNNVKEPSQDPEGAESTKTELEPSGDTSEITGNIED